MMRATHRSRRRLLAVLGVALAFGGCAATFAQSPAPGRALHPRTRSYGCVVRGPLPDPACTPGSVRTSDKALVCTPGSSRRARDVSAALKREIYAAYGIRRHRRGAYEIDHLVALELGGANDAANLWPEAAAPVPGFHEKDALENQLHERVCAGSLALAAAQREIAANWVGVWQRAGRPR